MSSYVSPSSTFAMLLVIKATVILSVAWITVSALSRQSAAQRHRVWATGILGVLVLPLLTMLMPARYAGALTHIEEQLVSRASLAARTISSASPVAPVAIGRTTSQDDFRFLIYALALLWAAGFVLLALKLVAGIAQLLRMSARAESSPGLEWSRMIEEERKRLGIRRRIRILECSDGAAMPMTWGVVHPCMLVPAEAMGWSEERKRMVLAHEFTHIVRHDWLVQMCGELLCCVYWFNPLAWIAARKLRQESEQACDDVVLSSGVTATDYAEELLEIVQTLGKSERGWSMALAIVRPSDLERRFQAMLSATANRKPLSMRGKLMIASGAVCLLLPLAAIRVPAQHPSNERSTAPRGWFLAGTKPGNYLTGVDLDTIYQGRPSAYLKAKPSATEGFGTLMQSFSAEQYWGKRVRLAAWVKSDEVNSWAGLWMRVDKGTAPVAFDNMENRAIQGTADWRKYSVVLDVPQDTTGIFFGILLDKGGKVWLNGVQFEVVGTEIPTTGTGPLAQPQPKGPANLNFEK